MTLRDTRGHKKSADLLSVFEFIRKGEVCGMLWQGDALPLSYSRLSTVDSNDSTVLVKRRPRRVVMQFEIWRIRVQPSGCHFEREAKARTLNCIAAKLIVSPPVGSGHTQNANKPLHSSPAKNNKRRNAKGDQPSNIAPSFEP